MRVIRSAGQNVSPSDDGRLYDQIFTDGLFEDTTITNLGANNIALGTLYGVISGRDFTAEAQTIAAVLPEGDTEETGYIYVEIDTSSDDVITINSALAPFTPTYEDINTNGAVVQMILAEYTASAVAVTSITPTYSKASSGTVLPGSVATVEESTAVANHSAGEYILLGGQLYKVTRAISAGETITPGSNVSATSVGAQLNELNNDLNTLSGYKLVNVSASSVSLPSEITFQGENFYEKIGRVVTLHVNLKIVSSTKKSLTIGNFISTTNDAPKYTTDSVGSDGDTDGIAQPFAVLANGSLNLWNTKTGTTYCQGTIKYIAKDY